MGRDVWNALPPRALIGTSAAILALQADARLAEASDVPVLITGETGVGKRALAMLIHSRGHRQRGPFRSVTCAGVPDTELEAQLFGHAGPSSDQESDALGLLHAAHDGTLFLNGIDEISGAMQTRLWRFLETDEIAPVDSDVGSSLVDVRIIAGASPYFFDRVVTGAFRPELYYRINIIHLVVPPLRERLDDLPRLLRECLAAHAQKKGIAPPMVSLEAEAELLAYRWPGNLTELEDTAAWLVTRAGAGTIQKEDLPPSIVRS